MRTWRVTGISGSLILAGPTALAFFAGGYFTLARTWAGVVTAGLTALLLLGELVSHRGGRGAGRLPSSRAVRLALLSLVALAVWTLASIAWAPIAGRAYGAGQIAVLYAFGLLIAAVALQRSATMAAWLEPALAMGVLIVTGYGLSGRMLPGLIAMTHSVSADGRLEQPLTYWNAMGELAAIGFVLCARIGGDLSRRFWLRATAAAAGAPIGLALYLSFSRGALYACAAGLIAVIVVAPNRAQLRGLLTTLGTAVTACVAAGSLPGVTALQGNLSVRETQGLEALAGTLVVMLAAVAVLAWSERPDGARRLRLPRRSGWIAAVLVCAGLALATALGAKEKSGVPLSGNVSRLATLQSNRYDYWHVALEAFAHAPVVGVGAGGWSVWWLQKRPYPDAATDAHSLELQTLAELGLVGAGLLAVFLISSGYVARTALRRDPAAAAGPLAGALVWLVHSPLDWDWQMPALTLVAVVLLGGLIAIANPRVSPGAQSLPPPVLRRPRRALIPPAIIGSCAAIACGWFVLGVRQAQSQNAVEAAIVGNTRPLSSARGARLEALLHEAGALNPDRQIDLDRATVLLELRQASAPVERARDLRAQAIIRRVLAAEPENLQAWVVFAHASLGDPRQFRYALERARELEPLLPPS